MVTYAAITGWGKCLPPAILTNDDLATFLDTNDEWIMSRTGISTRRISHVPLADLAYVSAARALAAAGLEGADVELIVMGSCTFDDQVPNQASGLQVRLGAKTRSADGRQHGLHQFPVRAQRGQRNDPHRHRAQRAGARRRGHFRIHGVA
jgi:3-oxoacyl-[acyl-carrier-protein] synthase III